MNSGVNSGFVEASTFKILTLNLVSSPAKSLL
jgi:hypothetical protein